MKESHTISKFNSLSPPKPFKLPPLVDKGKSPSLGGIKYYASASSKIGDSASILSARNETNNVGQSPRLGEGKRHKRKVGSKTQLRNLSTCFAGKKANTNPSGVHPTNSPDEN